MARTRIPHRLLVPAPDRLEHDADEAWRRGPLAGAGRTRQARRGRGGGHGDGAVPDGRRRRGQAADTGPAVRRQPGPGTAAGPTPRSSPVRRSSSCAGRRGRRPMPRGTGPRRRWPTTRWQARRSSTPPPRARPIRCSTAPAGAKTCARMRRHRRPHAQGRADRRRGRPTARRRFRAGRRFGRCAVRAAGRRCRPGRRRGRALRHDADRVDDDPRIP